MVMVRVRGGAFPPVNQDLQVLPAKSRWLGCDTQLSYKLVLVRSKQTFSISRGDNAREVMGASRDQGVPV